MDPKKSSPGRPKKGTSARYRGMDPNQVAYNLARARQLRGWTQDEAAAALGALPGRALVQRQLVPGLVRHRLGDVRQWEGWLRTLADHPADVDVQTRELAGDKPAVINKPAARTSETP